MSSVKHHAWVACDAINRMITENTFEDAHNGIQQVRAFLEARAEQSAPPWPEDQPKDDFTDLLGV